MKCLYCQNKCEVAHWDDLQSRTVELWKCMNCPNKVLFAVDVSTGELTQTYVGAVIKDKKYSVQFLHWNNVCRVNLVSDEAKTVNSRLIKEFPFHPDITPSNIREKLPTILTFS